MASLAGRIEQCGPIIEVRLMASPDRVMVLKAAGLPYPKPATVRALIDTGASCSAVDLNIAMGLGLQPTSSFPVHTPSSGPQGESMDVYDLSVGLGKTDKDIRTFTVGMIGAHLASQGFCALLGWDILDHCMLVCDGPSKVFTLSF